MTGAGSRNAVEGASRNRQAAEPVYAAEINSIQEALMKEKPTEAQLAEIRRLSKEARVPDESVIVTSREEADIRIRDLKEKARME
jgi:hypothetical protein